MTDSLDEFWQESCLTEANQMAFGTRIAAYEPVDMGIHPLTTAGGPTSLRRVSDRVQKLLESRVSTREFSDKALTARQVERLLASVGGRPDGGRLVPSAGGLNSIHTFAFGSNVKGACAGRIVRYDPDSHTVFDAGVAPSPARIRDMFQLDCVGEPQLLMIFLIDSFELRRKYGARAGRFAMQEVGHAAQNVSLRLAADHLSGFILGGSMDHDVLDALGAAHTSAWVGGAVACGR